MWVASLFFPVGGNEITLEKRFNWSGPAVASERDELVKKRPTVLLVDDHAAFLDEIGGLLTPNYEIVGTARDGRSGVEAALRLHPDIVVLDIEMPIVDGIAAARAIRQAGLATKVVFLTMHNDADYVTAALETGAQGYVFKSRVSRDLIFALEEVMANRTFVSLNNAQRSSRTR